MTERNVLESSMIADAARAKIAAFHAETIDEVRSAIREQSVVVVGMAQNPFVKRARKALDAAGVAYRYLEYGSYLGEWKRRLAIKLWTGWPTFPQVFVAGVLVGGAEEVEAGLKDGTLKAKLAAR